MRRAVRASDGVDEIVDDADTDAIPRRRHRRTSVPQIGRRIETIHRVRILIAVRRIIPPSDGVEQTSNHRRPFKERKNDKTIWENERKLKESWKKVQANMNSGKILFGLLNSIETTFRLGTKL